MVRHKKRYIIVEFRDTNKVGRFVQLSGHDPHLALDKAVKSMHGAFGYAMVQPLKIKYLSPKCGLMLVRCPHEAQHLVLSSFAALSSIGSVAVTPVVIRVAATPKAAHAFLRKYNEGMLEEYIKNQEKYTELKVDLDSSDE